MRGRAGRIVMRVRECRGWCCTAHVPRPTAAEPIPLSPIAPGSGFVAETNSGIWLTDVGVLLALIGTIGAAPVNLPAGDEPPIVLILWGCLTTTAPRW